MPRIAERTLPYGRVSAVFRLCDAVSFPKQTLIHLENMGNLIPVVTILIGIAIGAALGWLLLRAKARAANAAELATLKERLTGKETELQKLQAGFDAALAEHNRTRDHNSQLNAELAAERRAAQAREESFKQAADELSGRFAELFTEGPTRVRDGDHPPLDSGIVVCNLVLWK